MTLPTVSLASVQPVDAVQITTAGAIPLWLGQLHAVVGEGESGKTWLGVHTALDVADAGHSVLVIDGEMSANSWLRRFHALAATPETLARIHYVEMGDNSLDVEIVKATIAKLGAKIVVWDSALSLISRNARSENDNAEVSKVYDRLRDIVRNGPAGLIVDHTTRGSGTLISRGATAKFNALDVSYGVRLTEGSIPGPTAEWSSQISVEKDRHGLLGARHDRTALFVPLGSGNLHIDLSETTGATHRLSTGNPITVLTQQIAAMNPPPKSGNEAFKTLRGHRAHVLAAYKAWSETND